MYHPRLKGKHYDMGQRYETVACWLFALYCFESDHGCSVFAVRSGEHTYFGRNMDMFPEYKKTSESVLYMPENQNIFLAHSTAMICVEDGMNEHGLAAALTFLLPKTVKPGINGGFLIRLIFEKCKELLSGKRGFLCQYEKKPHFETIWSAVYDLNNLCNEICEGNSAKSAFRTETRLAWGMNKAKRK